MRLIQIVSCFTLLLLCTWIFNTSAYVSFETERDITLYTNDDTNGMLAMAPYGENGIYFIDNNSDGMYEIEMTDASYGEYYTIQNVFKITNNFNHSLDITISDQGAYSAYVSFIDGPINLETEGKTLSPGSSIYVDIFINAQSLGANTLLVTSFSVYGHYNAQEIISFTRIANIKTMDTIILTLLDHDEYGLSGGTAKYYTTTWINISGQTSSNGELQFSTEDEYSQIRMSYNDTHQDMNLSELESSNYTWQTGKLHWNGYGPPPSYIYLDDGWHYYVNDQELMPGTYTIKYYTYYGWRYKNYTVYAGYVTNFSYY